MQGRASEGLTNYHGGGREVGPELHSHQAGVVVRARDLVPQMRSMRKPTTHAENRGRLLVEDGYVKVERRHGCAAGRRGRVHGCDRAPADRGGEEREIRPPRHLGELI